MTTKTIDDSGRLSLGPEYAGQTVIVDDSDPDRLVITRATASDAREDDDGETVKVESLTNAELRELAAKHRPPAAWFEGDEAEWAELEGRALPSERLDAIADFLRLSGNASA